MLAYVNGEYIAADAKALPVNDRSFLYGDGLFETIRITNGQPFLWREHLDRLRLGAAFLRIPFENSNAELEHIARHLLGQNDCPEGFLRIHLSRGPSERGYSIKTASRPALAVTTHPALHAPLHRGLRLVTARTRVLGDDPAARHKTANRLPNILARIEAEDAGADEALLLNHRGDVAEASSANLFCLRGNRLATPDLNSGALAGTTRAFVLSLAAQFDLIAEERAVTQRDLLDADAVFLTSAHWLVAPVLALDGADLPAAQPGAPHPAIVKLRRACEAACLG
jgi:branched-chain amino acid aminotransferase